MRIERAEHQVFLDGRPVEVEISYRNGASQARTYAETSQRDAGAIHGTLTGRSGDVEFRILDAWLQGPDRVSFTREIKVSRSPSESEEGIGARLALSLVPGNWRFFVPGACYDYSPNEGDAGWAVVSEERTAYPLVMAHDSTRGEATVLLRESPAELSRAFARERGERVFLHATDLGAVGYRRQTTDRPAQLIACMPRREGPTSRMLDRSLSAMSALLPPGSEARFSYRIAVFRAGSFDAACLRAFELAREVARPAPPSTRESPAECALRRAERLAELARDWNGHAGFDLNFDPRLGVGTPPSGYGTGFNTLESDVFPQVLEYGFTGRQLNNAATLSRLAASAGHPEWRSLARRVVESFLRSCVERSGFLHTLYDVKRREAISPFGDPVGSLLHYGVKGAPAGNYVRNMAEAALDLLLVHRAGGGAAAREAALAFGDFLVRTQNRDGSWYRAYTPDGAAIREPEAWFGAGERANKSSTSTAVPFLLELHDATRDRTYLKAGLRAGEWLLKEVVEPIDYRGGTLDNPNVVDKEGMAYAMSALWRLHEATRSSEFLDGGLRSGGLALTWNCLWDVPFEPGTRLGELAFRSRGWGGISILWGTGVVDIYSLWFLKDWLRLGKAAGRSVFADVCALVLHGTQQMLALPSDLLGLVAPGMQEEGFACSDQGSDEGMIRKGSTWGSLGWVYGAGTSGVWDALGEEKEEGGVSASTESREDAEERSRSE